MWVLSFLRRFQKNSVKLWEYQRWQGFDRSFLWRNERTDRHHFFSRGRRVEGGSSVSSHSLKWLAGSATVQSMKTWRLGVGEGYAVKTEGMLGNGDIINSSEGRAVMLHHRNHGEHQPSQSLAVITVSFCQTLNHIPFNKAFMSFLPRIYK